MVILAIETSCDESAVSILKSEGGLKNPSFSILGNALYSQASLHAEYGGVFPNLAKREHQRNLVPLLEKALQEASSGIFNFQFSIFKEFPSSKIQTIQQILEREPVLLEQLLEFLPKIGKPPVDALAVTNGPGLAPALWVGVNFAKALAAVWDLPVMPVNHIEGHTVSALLRRPEISKNAQTYTLSPIVFPAVTLSVAGGHTHLALMRQWGAYELLGETRDDAAGEAFDKAARLMGLPYPGGPEISRLAKNMRGSPSTITLPRPMLHSNDFDFSFSGLKTAVRRAYEAIPEDEREAALPHLAREFEDAVVEVLVAKTIRAVETTGAQTILVGGGVSANVRLREVLTEAVRSKFGDMPLCFPDQTLTGDNAIMIGVAAALRLLQNPKTPDPSTIVADGNLKLAY